METNKILATFFLCAELLISFLAFPQQQKTYQPPKRGFIKSTEQNQPTGSPGYVVNQQTSAAQKTISTPKKKKNKKKIYKAKSKKQNIARTNGVSVPPSPNDYISYGISAPTVEKNSKAITKQKSVNQQQLTGDVTIANTNNIKPPRKEAKKGGNLKGGISPSQRSAKSAEQNQPTGLTDIAVTEQSNDAQKIVSTPQKRVNDKKRMAAKSAAQNIANQNGNPYPPSPNDYVSYGITAPELEKNPKQLRKQQSNTVQKATGNELLEHQYNIKPPREEAKRGGVAVSGVPVPQRGIKSAAETGFQGDREPRSEGIANNSSKSLVIPMLANSKDDVTHMTTYEGKLQPRSEGIANNSSTSLVIPMLANSKDDVTHMTTYEGNYEHKSTGKTDNSSTDLVIPIAPKSLADVTIQSNYRGNIDYGKLGEVREKMRNSNDEIGSNVGDIVGVYQQMKDAEKKNAGKVRDYKGNLDYNILAKRAAHQKELDKEMGSSQGDIVGRYQKMKDIEKESAKDVKEYRGTFDYGILKDRENLRKEKEAEIAKNTGDIIGSYMDMRNRWKEQNEKIKDYRGKIDYNVLKKNKDKMIALDKDIYSNTGDILTISLEKKKSTLREKSRKATWYEGDMIVTKRTRSNHPSAVYIEAKDSKSIEAKERLRKRMIKKYRQHREKEDPKYMQQPLPRPRYDEREYQIWESKTREGDVGFTIQAKESKATEGKIKNEEKSEEETTEEDATKEKK